MGSRGACLILIAPLLALASCGGDDDNDGASGGDTATTTTTAARTGGTAAVQDAQAKADARELVSYVEACFVDEMDYSACRDAGRGQDLGDATVESADAATFTVVSPSESGTEFRLREDRERVARASLRAAWRGRLPGDRPLVAIAELWGP